MHTKLLEILQANLGQQDTIMRSITDVVQKNGRKDLSAGEQQRFDAARVERDAIGDRISELAAEDEADIRSAETLRKAGLNLGTSR